MFFSLIDMKLVSFISSFSWWKVLLFFVYHPEILSGLENPPWLCHIPTDFSNEKRRVLIVMFCCPNVRNNSQQRFCWVSISAESGARKCMARKTGTLLELSWNPGTLLKLCWNPAKTLLEPCWNCAENLLGPCGKLAATLQEPCAGISVETLAGVAFVIVCFVLLWLICRVVMLEVWLELCWNRFAALPEPIWRQLLDFLWVLCCSHFFLKCFLLCFICWAVSG